jgi:hypothetical protein
MSTELISISDNSTKNIMFIFPLLTYTWVDGDARVFEPKHQQSNGVE